MFVVDDALDADSETTRAAKRLGQPFAIEIAAAVADALRRRLVADSRLHLRSVVPIAGGGEQRLLVLGSGDGFVALRAVARLTELEATVVEIDGDVARLCDELLNPGVFSHPRIALRVEDAAGFVENASRGGARFDAAIVDLTDVPVAAKSRPVASFYERVLAATCGLLGAGSWLSVQARTPEAVGASSSFPYQQIAFMN